MNTLDFLNFALRARLALLLVAGVVSQSGWAVDAAVVAEARVVVKYREASVLRKQVQSADRAHTLSATLGLSIAAVNEPAPGMQTLRARNISAAEFIDRLEALPDVEYAVQDMRKFVRFVPNDQLFGRQWYLQAAQPAGLDVVRAWDLLPQGLGPVVALVDTGVRPEHPDLAGQFLPGYDFISDAPTAADGNGRDADPTDMGDFLTATDLQDPDFAGCASAPTESTWHGTRMAGLLAAVGDNNLGIAGITRGQRLLPLRVLGKCGGFDSDIVAAMRWAAGLAVPGVAQNGNPARIVNLSLGSAGACSQLYAETIGELAGRGVLVVAAAGNTGGAVETPANCPGVLAVAGLRHAGGKVGYSSLGSEVGIAAPSGNCVNMGAGEECLFPIDTTTDLGATVPAQSGYTDGFTPSYGTSFSTALASGVAALMWQSNANLTLDLLRARLKAAATPFPQEPTLPTCPTVGAVGSDIDGQCNCTTTTCGAGMLDAFKSVGEAWRPLAAIQAPAQAQVWAAIGLDGSASLPAPTRRIVTWQWRVSSGPAGAQLQNATAQVASLVAASPGNYRVALLVTDNQGGSDEVESTITVEAVAQPVAGGGGGGGLGLMAWLGIVLLGAVTLVPGRARPD